MATIAMHGQVADASASTTHGTLLPRSAPSPNPGWVLRRARPGEVRAIETLFWKLHTFNANLDPRLALAEGWEAQLDPALERALAARDVPVCVSSQSLTGCVCGCVCRCVPCVSRFGAGPGTLVL